MSEPDKIVVETVDEHEDGSATFTVMLDEGVRESLASEGLKLILHCAAANMDVQLVYDFIEDYLAHDVKSLLKHVKKLEQRQCDCCEWGDVEEYTEYKFGVDSE
jgi:hypothetical protein